VTLLVSRRYVQLGIAPSAQRVAPDWLAKWCSPSIVSLGGQHNIAHIEMPRFEEYKFCRVSSICRWLRAGAGVSEGGPASPFAKSETSSQGVASNAKPMTRTWLREVLLYHEKACLVDPQNALRRKKKLPKDPL
jgi:hypothetical protein